MKHNMYTVRDSKAEAFFQPFFSPNEDTATRALAIEMAQPNSNLAANPQDYDLFHIGEFDDITGKCIALDTPDHIVSCIHLMPNSKTNLKEVS